MIEDLHKRAVTTRSSTWRARAIDYLALERNVTIASAAVFLLGFGEELWKKFLPKYLEALGATTPIIGLFGTVEDFLDPVYQYPGGFIADHLGRRRAFLIFITLASLGYVVYLVSPSWPFIFIAPRFCNGVAKYGVTRNFRGHWDGSTTRTPRNGRCQFTRPSSCLQIDHDEQRSLRLHCRRCPSAGPFSR